MSGGYEFDGRTSVEVFVPSTGQSCTFPSLPDHGRSGHIMDGLLICGSSRDKTAATTCLHLWVLVHQPHFVRGEGSPNQLEDGPGPGTDGRDAV